jgi:rSAM/selenodomain-associated transferase 2
MSAADGREAIAVVIPVLGDARHLAELLPQLWRQHAVEIAVVSGRADTAIAELCRRHECRYLEPPANRGARLDAGARATTAPVLWFVHADAAPPPDALRAIAAAVRSGADGGCFRFAFQGPPRWYKRLLALAVTLRVRCGGMVYGDQGIFVTRERYFECGGFAPEPLFEEVRLIKCLRARRNFRTLPQALAVATRRWERDGWLRRTLHNRWLALRFMLGAPAASLAASYRPLLGSKNERRP